MSAHMLQATQKVMQTWVARETGTVPPSSYYTRNTIASKAMSQPQNKTQIEHETKFKKAFTQANQ